MNEKLKPCPFCGSNMIRTRPIRVSTFLDLWHEVVCAGCFSTTSPFEKKEDAIKSWNKRVKK